MVLYWIKVVEN